MDLLFKLAKVNMLIQWTFRKIFEVESWMYYEAPPNYALKSSLEEYPMHEFDWFVSLLAAPINFTRTGDWLIER